MFRPNYLFALRAALLGVCLGASALAGCGPSLAQDTKPTAAATAAAKQILVLKGSETIFGSLIPGVIEQNKSMFEQQNPAFGKDLATVAAQLRTELAPKLDEVTSEVARIYASHFTEKELTDMLAFYSSPLGRKMVAQEPRALSDGINYARDWAGKFSDEVVNRMRAEMKKLGHDI